MKQGFSVTQLMISLLISGLLSSGLFVSFFQIQKFQTFIAGTDVIDRHIAIVKNQLEQDLMAAFLPLSLIEVREKESQEKTKDKTSPEKKKEPHRAFVSKNKEGVLQELTFVSTHNIQLSLPDMTMQPYIVRITYTLEKNKENPLLFNLKRAQTLELLTVKEKKETQKIQSYTLADTIKKCEIQFTFEKKETEKKEEKAKDKSEKKPIFETAAEWDSDTAQKNKKPIVPLWAKITLIMTDMLEQQERTVEFLLPIAAGNYIPSLKKPAQAKPEEKKQKEEKTKNENGVKTNELHESKSNSIVQNKVAMDMSKMPSLAELKEAMKELMGRLKT